ncbi:MAG: CDP-alcohol phosphatidyltransferase family protein [Leeuwenhoekiella sp.]
MRIASFVPNAFTMANIFSGTVGAYFAATDRLDFAAYAVMAGIFFDFFDGFFARILNAQSEVGLQLDSLADCITSGVVPALVMYQLIHDVEAWGSGARYASGELHWDSVTLLPFLGFAIALASAYRLAKFNVDTRQTTSFIGLPTPANALLIISLPLILQFQDLAFAESLIRNVWFLIGLTALSCYLLNAEIPLFALKFKSFGFAENKVRYIFLALTLVLIFLLKFIAIPLVILMYVVISMATTKPDES